MVSELKLTLGILLFILAVFPLNHLSAYPVDLDKLPHQGRNSFGCVVCHLNPAGGEVTLFGADYLENAFRYDVVLKQKDSDGDGYSNDRELRAQPPSNPGDPDSSPYQPPNFWGWLSTLLAVLVLITGGYSFATLDHKPHS